LPVQKKHYLILSFLRIKSGVEVSDLKNILFHDLRIDPGQFSELDSKKLIDLSSQYKNKSIKVFAHYMKLRG